MAIKLEETVKQLTDFLRTEAKTETVIGQSFQLGEYTCMPVIKFGVGLGYGGGEGHGEQQGKGTGEGGGTAAGGAVGIAPIGFLATRGEQISFIPTNTSKGIGAAFEKIPDVIAKFLEKNKQPTAATTA